MSSLRDAADAADAASFVGRGRELALIADLLDPATPSRVLYLHGPGGIGKSAVLRAARRLAEERGFKVAGLDARALPIDLDLVRARVFEAVGSARLVIIDEADALGSALAPLRDALLDELPADAGLLLAARGAPEPSWRERGLHTIFADLQLGPLPAEEAGRLLDARGVGDPARRRALLEWAAGSPLALTIASSVGQHAPQADLSAQIEQRVTQWLAGGAALDIDPDVLSVAALCRVVDSRLLAAALPGHATRDAMQRLTALPVTQRLAAGVSLHPVLAAAIKQRLRVQSPGTYRTLTARIVDHLSTRAILGDVEALMEMTLLIETPALRSAVSMEASPTHYADRPHDGELAEFGHDNGFDTSPEWAALAAFAERPGAVDLVMRRNDGTAVFYGALHRVSDLPDDPLGRSLSAVAAATGIDRQRSFAGLVMFAPASEDDLAEATRISIGAFMRRHGVVDLEAVLIHYPEPARVPLAVTAALARPLDGPWAHSVHFTDLRPGGAVAFIQRAILAELGMAPPVAATMSLLIADDDPARQAALTALLDEVFSRSAADRRLRRVIELAHIGPRRSEQECLEELHVSRATWYRLLREARERVLANGG